MECQTFSVKLLDAACFSLRSGCDNRTGKEWSPFSVSVTPESSGVFEKPVPWIRVTDLNGGTSCRRCLRMQPISSLRLLSQLPRTFTVTARLPEVVPCSDRNESMNEWLADKVKEHNIRGKVEMFWGNVRAGGPVPVKENFRKSTRGFFFSSPLEVLSCALFCRLPRSVVHSHRGCPPSFLSGLKKTEKSKRLGRYLKMRSFWRW